MKRRTPRIWILCSCLALIWTLFGCEGTRPERMPISGSDFTTEGMPGLQAWAIDRVLDYRVWRGARAGFVALVAREGDVVYARTTGHAVLEDAIPMSLATRFHLASMTKPITAVAAMILVERGDLSLDDPVSQYIPSFAALHVVDERRDDGGWSTQPAKTRLLVRHLLTFSSGIGGYAETDDPLDQAWRSPDIEIGGLGSLAERIDLIPHLPLYEEPGEKWRYGWSADVLARVVEVAAGEPYDTFLARHLFEPLGMSSTAFPDDVPASAPMARLYTHDPEGKLIHDPQFEASYGRGWTPGGGGLVSTAPDYMRFALMLANGGVFESTRILKSETVAEMTRLQVPSGVLEDMQIDGLGWGLGFSVVADEDKTVMPSSNGDYWWSGRFGTHFWISPENETVVVVMQQTESGPYSDLPITPTLVQALAMMF